VVTERSSPHFPGRHTRKYGCGAFVLRGSYRGVRSAPQLRIVGAKLGLDELLELPGAERIQGLAVDEESRRLAHAQCPGVSQVLLDDAFAFGIVHAGPDGGDVEVGALQQRPYPVDEHLMVLRPLLLRRVQDVERLPELVHLLRGNQDLDDVRGSLVEGRVADDQLDLSGVGGHSLLDELREGRTRLASRVGKLHDVHLGRGVAQHWRMHPDERRDVVLRHEVELAGALALVQ